MGREDCIVRLYNSGGDLRRGGNGEAHLGLAAEVNSKTLEEQGSETGSSSSSSGVENEESLKSRAVVTHLADLVKDGVNDVLTDGVVTTGIVVSGVLLSVDDRFGVIEAAVLSGANGVTHSGLEIDHNGAGNVLAVLGLAEESVVGSILDTWRGVSGHLAILADAVLEAVELPA